jgi:tRNA (adenine37-N6)-methyltransferase
MSDKKQVFQVYPIGYVRRSEDDFHLEILEPYRPALQDLQYFSHVIVFFWADRFDNDEDRQNMTAKPPHFEDGRTTGVFATRSPHRPNPILTTPCRIVSVDETTGIIRVNNIDALADTAIIDLKAYYPVADRVKDATIPDWLFDWPEWVPDDGLGL